MENPPCPTYGAAQVERPLNSQEKGAGKSQIPAFWDLFCPFSMEKRGGFVFVLPRFFFSYLLATKTTPPNEVLLWEFCVKAGMWARSKLLLRRNSPRRTFPVAAKELLDFGFNEDKNKKEKGKETNNDNSKKKKAQKNQQENSF